MTSTPLRSLLPAAAAGFGLSLLSALPAGAHGLAGTGLAAGLTHPLVGPDHLLLLLGVGAAASSLGASLLPFAVAGALLGAIAGANGGPLPLAETLAALAVSALGLLILRSQPSRGPGLRTLAGPVVAIAVAIHAWLHGLEAPGGGLWWLGAALASTVLVLGSFAALRRFPSAWTLRLAVLLSLAGGALALVPLT